MASNTQRIHEIHGAFYGTLCLGQTNLNANLFYVIVYFLVPFGLTVLGFPRINFQDLKLSKNRILQTSSERMQRKN